jgi:hypothetical protein
MKKELSLYKKTSIGIKNKKKLKSKLFVKITEILF